ncbi:MAG TPA: hypothetical protein VM532_04595, partial [Burkholderiales bacterium]|nr:hypothetical protein [Burkholderiales bacterium]
MTITYHSLGRSYLDPVELPQMLRKEEGHVPGIYDDLSENHLATIGIGVNVTLKPYMALVLRKLGVFEADDTREAAARIAAGKPAETNGQRNQRYARIVNDFESVIASYPLSRTQNEIAGTSNSEIALQNALNTKLHSYFAVATLPSPNAFEIDEATAKVIKTEIILGFSIGSFVDKGKQANLDKVLQDNGTAIGHDTAEYKALMSLYFNAETLIGEGLLRALEHGNRAEAWFEIRFRSNIEKEPGIAKRRYYESQVFGVYEPTTNVTSEDAKQIYRMLNLHRDEILKYEKKYGGQIGLANSDYGLSDGQRVQSVLELLSLAKESLIDDLKSTYPTLSNLSMDDYSSLDIYLDPGRDTSKDPVRENHSSFLNAVEYNAEGVEIV